MLGCFQEGSGLTPLPLQHCGVTGEAAPEAVGSGVRGVGSGRLSRQLGTFPRAVSLTGLRVSSSVSKPLCTGVLVSPELRQTTPCEFPRRWFLTERIRTSFRRRPAARAHAGPRSRPAVTWKGARPRSRS